MRITIMGTLVGLATIAGLACNGYGERSSYETRGEEDTPASQQSAARELKKQAPADTTDTYGEKTEGAQVSTQGLPLKEDPGAGDGPAVSEAVAVLAPTEDNAARGVVRFTEKPGGGIEVKADIEQLPQGKHAYHLHLYGDCSAADGKSAGTHFNLDGSSTEPPADIARITGNLGELTAGEDGRASATGLLPKASLTGSYGILGRSVIVHGKGNDESQPPIGAAGPRLACGVIGIAKAAPQAHAAR